ncbi:hypothetical protein ACH518_18705 [Methylomonas sp. HW2-6]|uniref:hypothetical protein n=1 Tax=Methylomonas sp. HW2-6 TaxID=3376687 RepID=UPI0040414B5C
MQILSSQPISGAKILGTSIKLYVKSLPKLLELFWILAAFFAVDLILELLLRELDRNSAAVSIVETIQMIFWLPSAFCFFWVYPCIILRFDCVAKDREESLLQVFMIGLKKLWRLFLATLLPCILVGLTSMTMIGTVSVIPMLITGALSGAGNSTAMVLSTCVGLVLGFCLAATIAVSLAFYPYFIVIDSLPAYASLQASCKLAWGNILRTVVTYLAPILVAMVLSGAAGILTNFLDTDEQTSIISMVLDGVLFVCISSYFCALGYLQFHDLKLRQSNVAAAQ